LESQKEMTNEELLKQIEELHERVLKIKADGVSAWNFKSVLPKIFDVVNESFDVMHDVVKNLDQCSKK